MVWRYKSAENIDIKSNEYHITITDCKIPIGTPPNRNLRESRGGRGGDLRGDQRTQAEVSNAQFARNQSVWHQLYR